MLEIICAYCGSRRARNVGEVNRARKLGKPLYCSRLCGNAARTSRKKDSAWHHMRFTPRPSAVATTCQNCGRAMWLPPSKGEEYRSCSLECGSAHRKAEREKRRRDCETCGSSFIPRGVQIRNGGGRFCSQKCNPSEHLTSPGALAHAQQRAREVRANGEWTILAGAANPRWMGGKEAAVKRRTESGKNAEMLRRYRAKNPHKVREFALRRRGRKLGRLPYGTIPHLGEMQRWKCAICRTGLKAGYHVDHIMPIAKGGRHEPRNLQLLCQRCNVRKSAKDPIAYMQELGRLL